MEYDHNLAVDEQLEDLCTFHFHLSDLSSDLLKSLKAGPSQRSRLRYTCSDVSPNVTPILESPARYLALGTTSGSVHIFQYCPPQSSPALSVASSTTSLVIDGVPPEPPNNSSNSPPHTTIHHFLTIIHEDLIGPVTSVSFAPVQLVVSRPEESHEQSLTTSDDSDHSSNSSHDCVDHSTFANGNGHHSTPQRSSQVHQLHNIVLAIGSSKGSLLIVDINLQSKNRSITFFKLPYQTGASTRKWQVTYQNSTFTRHSINLLRWDNSSRLFIGDASGKLFVLHDVEEMKHLMILSAPTMLLNLDGVAIHQLDVSEKLLILSTNEPRVYLFNLDDGKLYPVGKTAKRSKRKDGVHLSGVGALSTYRMVELDTFHYDDSDFESEPEAFPKAYRLVSTDCQFFATRPKCRLWVVDLKGQVQFTQEFSELVSNAADSQVDGNQVAIDKILAPHPTANEAEETTELAANFGKLHSMYWRNSCNSSLQVFSYIVTHSDSDKSRIIVIDPNQQTILASSPPLKGTIVEIKCIGNDIFVSYKIEPNASIQLCVFTLEVKTNYDRSSLRTFSTSSLTEECDADGVPPVSPTESATYKTLNGQVDEQTELNSSSSNDIGSCHQDAQLSEVTRLQERAQLLYQYLLGSTISEDNFFSKCHCGLPLSSVFNCGQFDSIKLCLVPGSAEADVACHLLEMAYANGNWPLYMHMLAEMGESKFYLYFAILLDQPCLVDRHWQLFGRDTLTSESLWQDIFEYIGLCILGTDQPPRNLSPHPPDHQLIDTEANQITSNCVAVTTCAGRCVLCRLKDWAENECWEQIVSWFEQRLLHHCVLYCSPEFVTRVLGQIITKFIEPKVAPLIALRGSLPSPNSTFLFSLDFYLVLLHFEVMRQSTNRISKKVLTRLQQFTSKSDEPTTKRSQIVPLLDSAEAKPSPVSTAAVPWTYRTYSVSQASGRVVDLRQTNCSFCKKPILPTKSKGHPLRRQIKLYRSCEHVYVRHRFCPAS